MVMLWLCYIGGQLQPEDEDDEDEVTAGGVAQLVSSLLFLATVVLAQAMVLL